MKRKCEKCGSEFETNNENKRFCTERCRHRAEFKRRYDRTIGCTIKRCVICGNDFAPYKASVTCSKECSIKNRSRLVRKWNAIQNPIASEKRRKECESDPVYCARKEARRIKQSIIYEKLYVFKLCETCNAEYIANNLSDKYCSNKCLWRKSNERKKYNPYYRAIKSYYASIRRACKSGFAKDERWSARFGYGPKQLCRHIESKMLLGMTWANYGTVWHIDHVAPIAEVIGGVKSIDDVFSLSNLMPRFSTTKMANTFGWNQVGNLNKGAGKVNVYQI